MSGRGNVHQGSVRRGSLWSEKCPSGICPSGKCLSGMCPSGKCPSKKCPNTVSFFTFFGYFCVALPGVLRIWECFFYFRRVLPYTLFRHLAQTAFIKTSLGAGNSSLKVAGPPVEVRNIDWTHLFVWITQCSAFSKTH